MRCQSSGEVLARGVATARAAEAAGFDDIWVTEHHFVPFGVNPSALTFAGYLLGCTSTVRVGTAVVVLPLHAPVHVAEQAALLSHDAVLASHPVGTAQSCIERLVDQIRGSGCRRVLCQVEVGGDHDSVLANVKRLGEEVLPAVRARLAANRPPS